VLQPAWADQSLSQPDSPTNPTGPADRVAPQPNPRTLFPFCRSFANEWGRLDSLTPLFTVSHLSPSSGELAPHQRTRIAARRAEWDGCSAWLARTPSDRRAHAHGSVPARAEI
jgi:hypothetical protein